ncbi:MAG: molybdate ABC transporter substrate-binding protein [Silicimonas sp.]|nr:molybdate ABC transporter substrate-binding protein [Silicimonas sp.]
MGRLIYTCMLCLWGAVVWAEDVTLAVASNFLTTAQELARAFEAETGHRALISHGATGQIFAQINNGAPFDIFLSADTDRPSALLENGRALAVKPYALGRLVIVSSLPITQETAAEVVVGKTVALADPTVAPYGLAATRAMEGLSLDTATFRPVLVANVGQVGAVFATRNAQVAFVSAAQVSTLRAAHVLELEGLYGEIAQDAALMARAADNPAARAFWDWLSSDDARRLIEKAGYDLPQG